MPHTRSAKKSLRQTEKRRQRNRATKKTLKQQLKKFVEVVESGTSEQLKQEYNTTAMKLDKAAAKGVIHRNLAARKKSQLARALNKKAAGGAAAPAPAKS